MTPTKLASVGALALLLGWFDASPALAQPGPEQQFSEATKALSTGSFQQAIDRFELIADQGFQHPDASFNRALAYITRAESAHSRPGDLGRAAAAFSESLLLRPSDDQAREGLQRVREEIGRRRAREGAEQVIVSPSLVRAAAALVSENTWAVLASIASMMLTVGIVLKLWLKRAGPQLAGGVLTVLGSFMLLVTSAFAYTARHLRTTSTPAVVVSSEARLLDQNGRPLAQKGGRATSIPEGEQVFVTDEQNARAQIEWGNASDWVNRAQLQVLKL
jgi:hypothetical protein